MKMEKLCAAVLAVCLALPVSATAANVQDDIELKIGIYYGGTAKDSVTLSAADGFSYVSETDAGEQNVLFTDSSNSVIAEKNNSYGIRITNSYADIEAAQADAVNISGASAAYVNGQACLFIPGFPNIEQAQLTIASTSYGSRKAEAVNPDAGSVVVKKDGIVFFTYSMPNEFLALRPLNEQTITIGERAYRGGAMLKRTSVSDMTVINLVRMEPYLVSVLGMEIDPKWNLEAVKAQAVASKGFALTNINKYKKYGFHLDTTTNSQVYRGVAAEQERSWQAVRETMGVVALYDGKPAATYFFSSSGGRTEDAAVVWGGDSIPYLKGVEDPYEQDANGCYHTWQLAFTATEAKQKLSSSGIDVGEVTGIAVTERTANGRAGKVLVTGTLGETSLSGTSARAVFSLKSTNFSIYNQDGESGVPKPDQKPDSGTVSVLTANGMETIALDGANALTKNIMGTVGKQAEVITKDGIETLVPSAQGTGNLQEGGNPPSFTGDFLFDGGGYGHGVGMSQWGAKFMADAGFTYKQILQHYMPGIEFTK
jgi:stage II sporulation protein D